MNYPINKVAVLGSGVMGSGIAAYLAGAGIKVIMMDMVPREVNEKEAAKGLTLDSPAVRNRFALAGMERINNPKARVGFDASCNSLIEVGNFTDDLHKIAECDWIIEVIVENLNIKKSFMQDIAKYRRPGCIVSTNTSGVKINDICADMDEEFRQHFMGVHFFNPPRYMKLLELIPSKDVMPELFDFMADFCRNRLGKGVVIAKDTPNFVANRMGAYMSAVCIKNTEKSDLSFRAVDMITGQAMGRPKTGTFRTLDMVGIDLHVSIADNASNQFSDWQKEAYSPSKTALKLVDMGLLGDKVGEGFFKKVKDANGVQQFQLNGKTFEYEPMVEPELPGVIRALACKDLGERIKTLVSGAEPECKFAWELLKKGIIYAATNVPEITDDYTNIDKGICWGYNWGLGFFQIWDAIGVEESIKRMQAEGETVPQWVLARVAEGKTKFYDVPVDYQAGDYTAPAVEYPVLAENEGAKVLDLGDEVMGFRFKTKNNVTDVNVMTMLSQAVDMLEHSNNFIGMVITNEGKNFCPGADLKLNQSRIEKGEFEVINQSSKLLQDTLLKVKYCSRPIVSAPFGKVLGGGAEVVFACAGTVAQMNTSMGLVETSVGLVPAGGGIKERLVRAMVGKEDCLLIDRVVAARNVWDEICAAKTTSCAAEAKRKGFFGLQSRIVMSGESQLQAAKEMVAEMAKNGSHVRVPVTIPATGVSGYANIKKKITDQVKGLYISEYDAFVADKLAAIITGGNLPAGTSVSEQYILELERKAFVELCQQPKTKERIDHILKVGKPLKN